MKTQIRTEFPDLEKLSKLFRLAMLPFGIVFPIRHVCRFGVFGNIADLPKFRQICKNLGNSVRFFQSCKNRTNQQDRPAERASLARNSFTSRSSAATRSSSVSAAGEEESVVVAGGEGGTWPKNSSGDTSRGRVEMLDCITIPSLFIVILESVQCGVSASSLYQLAPLYNTHSLTVISFCVSKSRAISTRSLCFVASSRINSSHSRNRCECVTRRV
jgi:hypothetical protein